MVATRKTAFQFILLFFFMSGQMILKVLRHLEGLVATLKCTLVEPHLEVRLEVLLLFGVFRKHFVASMNGAVDIILSLLSVIIENSKRIFEISYLISRQPFLFYELFAIG